jgi:hypothetical protein
MIRIFLFAGFVGIGMLVTFGRDTAQFRASRKVLFLFILALGVMAVLYPDTVTAIANVFGVGRGADLLLYVLTMMTLTTTTFGYLDKKRSDRREAVLVQRVAIIEAELLALQRRR